MKKMNYIVLCAVIMGLTGITHATQIYLSSATGELAEFETNGSVASCVAQGLAIGEAVVSLGLSGGILATTLATTDAIEKKIVNKLALGGHEKVGICTVGELWVRPLDADKYCIAGAHNDFYSQIVVPTGQIWQAKLVRIEDAQGKPLIKMKYTPEEDRKKEEAKQEEIRRREEDRQQRLSI